MGLKSSKWFDTNKNFETHRPAFRIFLVSCRLKDNYGETKISYKYKDKYFPLNF